MTAFKIQVLPLGLGDNFHILSDTCYSCLFMIQNLLGLALAFKNGGIMGNETGNVRLRKGCS